MNQHEAFVSEADALAIGRLDAHDQAALVMSGDLTPRALVQAAILRIERLDPTLNVMTFRDYDAALARSDSVQGPMAGVPWLLKDGLDYPGMPCRSGSRSKRDLGPGTVAFDYTNQFDASGLVALGKTNAPEFGLLPTTEPILYGPTRNPWALDRSPGGSSGGGAAAVAAGMIPVAHAADGGGSIRIPASCCGLVGLKPGRGGNLRAREQHLIEDLLSCDVLLSRSVRDVAWATAVGADRPQRAHGPGKRRLRIAVVAENLEGALPAYDVANVLRRTADLCAVLGHAVDVAPLPVDGPAVTGAFRTIWGYLARDAVAHAASRLGADAVGGLIEPWTRDLAAWSDTITAAEVGLLFEQVGRASGALAAFFDRYDLILSPVTRQSAPLIGDLGPTRPFDEMMEHMFDYVSYTPLHNLTGSPAISLPLFTGEDGIPIGSMFAAARGNEDLLLELAFELEMAAPWANRWPGCSIANPDLGSLLRP